MDQCGLRRIWSRCQEMRTNNLPAKALTVERLTSIVSRSLKRELL